MKPARRFDGIELSLIRKINALATPLSINLGIGEPNVEPDETLGEFARKAATTSWHYSANAGTPALRQRLAATTGYEARDEICVTAGTQEGLFAIMQAYLDPGDEVLIPNPGFLSYATLTRIAGGAPVSYPLEPPEWRFEAGQILDRITPRTKLIIINSPSNPLGSVVEAAVLNEIAQAGPLVISDEVYREIWYEDPPASMAHLSDNVLVVNGMSKSHGMTGLRLAWILARPEVLKPIITAHQYVATCASVFSQALAEQILAATAWNAEWLRSVRAQFSSQRAVCLQSIENELHVAIPAPMGAFYAFTPVPSCDTERFCTTLATDAAVLAIPGVAFGPAGEGFVRISFASSGTAVQNGIQRIGRYLAGAGR